MPVQTAFGQKTGGDFSGDYLQIKAKGGKITIRFLAPYKYAGVHWVDNKKYPCPRINKTGECELCSKFFAELEEVKTIEDKEEQEKQMKIVKDKLSKTEYFYPVINRETGKGQIFKTAKSVMIKIDDDANNDIDVTRYDYKITRTETPSNYYAVSRMDSELTLPFTPDEKLEIPKILARFDKLLSDKPTSTHQKIGYVEPEAKENLQDIGPTDDGLDEANETINDEDIPFNN